MSAPTLLNLDIDMLTRLENDLIAKVTAGYAAYPDIGIDIYGVFSLDHLEQLQEASLNNQLAAGVAYLSAENPDATLPLNPGMGQSAQMVLFNFIILLAVPTVDAGATRYSVGRLLTVLRKAIQGSRVEGNAAQRTWKFMHEKPQISESSRTMLYYSQVWQIAIPSLGNLV